MPRPTFALSDDEARQIVAGVNVIEQRHPLNSTNHKPFLRAFLKLVYEVTGRTLSPLVYRRLLNAFAPGRTPSTTTIAFEKDRLVDELEREQRNLRAGEAGSDRPYRQADFDMEALQASIMQLLRQGKNSTDAYLQQQCTFLQQRLSATERELVEAKSLASELTAAQAAARQQAKRDQEEIESLRTSNLQLTKEISNLATIVEESRRFALMAIEESRAETRTWKARWQHAESQVKEQEATTEVFRRLAYRQGADIPKVFNKPEAT